MNKLCPSMKTIKATKNNVGKVKFPPMAVMLDEFEKAVLLIIKKIKLITEVAVLKILIYGFLKYGGM